MCRKNRRKNRSQMIIRCAMMVFLITALRPEGVVLAADISALKRSEAYYISHRGLSSQAPENTLPAFELACNEGFQGVECDIWEVKKENGGTDFVVFHDATLDRMTDFSGRVADQSFEALLAMRITAGNGIGTYGNETIPSLEAYLDVIRVYAQVRPVIEIKSDGEDAVSGQGILKLIGLLEEKGLKDRAEILSFSKEVIRRLQNADPDLSVFLLTNVTGDQLLQDIRWAADNRADGVSVKRTSLYDDACSLAHSLGLKVGVYGVDRQFTATRFIRTLGVDRLSSNYRLFSMDS